MKLCIIYKDLYGSFTGDMCEKYITGRLGDNKYVIIN